MATITINLSDELVEAVRAFPDLRELPLEQQVEKLLREEVRRRREREEIIARFDAIAAMTPKGIVQTDSTLLLREDRDR